MEVQLFQCPVPTSIACALKADFSTPACYLGYNCRVGNAQSAGHGPYIEQPAVDGGLGISSLSSLPPRPSPAVLIHVVKVILLLLILPKRYGFRK
jgi:hypothetical protein